ncbi:MAG: type IV secretion protein Rhs [Acidobacteria bacterium]|nr:type IV secretion protein Rhs [Acidobacteriota bacterium]MBI3428097.1 type IV secretion protein Rhs [Acidobacteriota bacterium]
MRNTALDLLLEARVPTGLGGLWYGVFPALVSDIRDPDGQGRVKVLLPSIPDTGDSRYEVWARLATLMGGDNRGSWFIPDVNDEVLVAFEGGNPRRPYVIGALWNGRDRAPETMDGAGNNHRKVLRSRNGVKVTLDDTTGQEKMVLETPGGQKITLKDGPGSIEVVDSNGNSVKLESAGITINAAAKVTISASQITLRAPIVSVDAGNTNISGVTRTDTHISNSVISASYTPGAGNIW